MADACIFPASTIATQSTINIIFFLLLYCFMLSSYLAIDCLLSSTSLLLYLSPPSDPVFFLFSFVAKVHENLYA